MRTKVRQQQQTESELRERVKDLETDLQLFEKSRSLVTVYRRGPSQQGLLTVSPVRSASQEARSISPRGVLPLSQMSSPPPYSVLPSRKRSIPETAATSVAAQLGLNDDTNPAVQKMKLRNDILEEELAVAAEESVSNDCGRCPHCDTTLLANHGGMGGKAAFCFSCRRSFSADDLALRDRRQRSKQK